MCLSAPALQWQSKKKIESLIGEEGSHATRGDRIELRDPEMNPVKKALLGVPRPIILHHFLELFLVLQ